MLEDFMRPTIPQNCSKFDTIRFTGYRVIGEKPCVIYLPKLFCAMCRKKTMHWIKQEAQLMLTTGVMRLAVS